MHTRALVISCDQTTDEDRQGPRQVFTPEATLSGVARRSLSGQHASTPAAAAAEGPYLCVALGDPIMDLIGFERGNLLDDHGFEKGGCVAVDNYDDILRLQASVNYARVAISRLSFSNRARKRQWGWRELTIQRNIWLTNVVFAGCETGRLQRMVDLQSRVPGGSAANVVKGIAGLAALRGGSTAGAVDGAPLCAFVGKVGEDAAGHEYAKRLAAAGVQVSLEYKP